MSKLGKNLLLGFAILGGGLPVAQAQFAVIDVASVAQLMSEVKTLEQQLATAQADLAQAQTAYRSTVGDRGMEQLLAGTVRNYLPPNWSGFLPESPWEVSTSALLSSYTLTPCTQVEDQIAIASATILLTQ